MKLNQTKNKTFRRDLIVEIYYIKNQKQNKQRQYLKKEKKQTKTKHFRTDLMVKFTIKNKKKENKQRQYLKRKKQTKTKTF